MYTIKYFKNNLNIGYKSIIIILKKAPTPKWMLQGLLNVLTDTAHPVCETGWAFYFRLFLLSRKAITATSKLPKFNLISRYFIRINLVAHTSCGAPPNMVKC